MSAITIKCHWCGEEIEYKDISTKMGNNGLCHASCKLPPLDNEFIEARVAWCLLARDDELVTLLEDIYKTNHPESQKNMAILKAVDKYMWRKDKDNVSDD